MTLLALCVCQQQTHAQQARTPQKLSAPQPSTHAPQKSGAVQKSYVEGEVLVQFVNEKVRASARTLNARIGATVVREFADFGGWQQLKLPQGLTVEAAIKRYRAAAGVRIAQPNFIYHPTDTTPNDPSFNQQYGPAKVSAPLAWDTTTGSSAVVVAIVDTGIRYTHEDLSANMWRNPGETGLDAQGHDKATNGIDDDGDGYVDDVYGINTAYNTADPLDDFGHGTHVAGIVGAVGNNGLGVAGVNWSVQLMALKMFDASGNGTSVTAIGALQYVLMMKRRGVNVRATNNSWGGAPEAPAYDQALRSAFDALGAADILNACAAGNAANNNDTAAFYPASYDVPAIISVAASDSSDNRASFSSYGATTVDLAAPGVNILSTMRGSDSAYGFLSGTSMASPMVAGAAALVAAHTPSLSALSIKAALMNSVDVLPQWSGLTVTGGRLNVAHALQSSTVCSFNATPASAAFTESGGTGMIDVTAAAGCNWIATSNASWISITVNANGYGTNTVTYAVTANSGAARTGQLVVADQLLTVTQAAGVPPPDPLPPPAASGQVLISEFRLDGPGGADDQFVELYNNTDQPVTVWTDDGSAGWALVSATDAGGALAALCVIPNGTSLPARGHYLYTTARSYTLQSYGGASRAAGDATGVHIYANAPAQPFAGLALFRSSNAANWTLANELDAVGGSLSSALLREGAGLPQNFAFVSDVQYSWTRRLTSGFPQDTNDNAQDFVLVSTTGGNFGGLQSQLGAPAPENSASPIQRNATIKAALVDTGVLSSVAPNRERDTMANVCGNSNCALGTLTIRRKFTNKTGQSVTRLRFRVVDITTLNSPGGPQADLRALDSGDTTVSLSGGGTMAVKGTTIEQPPVQLKGGGLNSTMTVALPAPLGVNASVAVQFVLGVQQGGNFRFLVNVEALP
jgi:subtilisin family serine protease